MSQNIQLLTGIPRSGTTLCCHLLNEAADTVALHEPIAPDLFSDEIPPVEIIESEINRFRQSLLADGRAVSKQLNGEIPANPVQVDATRDRKESVTLGEIRAGKSLSQEFSLVIKHNALFAALLPSLKNLYPVSCIVRNPLPVLASWQSVDLPVARGTVPMAERFDDDLRSKLAVLTGVMEKQLAILGWFFDRFRNQSAIIRYEEVITTGGENLSMVACRNVKASSSLGFQNRNAGLASDQLKNLADTLLAHPEIYEGFYTPGQVEQQLSEMLD